MELSGFKLEDFVSEDGKHRQGWVLSESRGGSVREDNGSPSVASLSPEDADMYENAAVRFDGTSPQSVKIEEGDEEEVEDEEGWENAGVYQSVHKPSPPARIRTSSLSIENMFEAFTRAGWFGGSSNSSTDGSISGVSSRGGGGSSRDSSRGGGGSSRGGSGSSRGGGGSSLSRAASSFFGSFIWNEGANGILPVVKEETAEASQGEASKQREASKQGEALIVVRTSSADRAPPLTPPPVLPGSPLGTSLDDVTISRTHSEHTDCSASEFDKRERDIITQRGSYALGGPTTLTFVDM